MTTAATLIDRSVQELLAGTVEERNKLASPLTDTTGTTVTLTYPVASLRDNSIVQVGDELMYVWQVNASAKQLTVERGYGGSTASTHTAGTITVTNPRFPRWQVLNHLNSELLDLSSPVHGLFQVKTLDLAYNGSDRMINLTGVTGIIDLFDVRYRYLNDDYPIVRNVRLLRDMPTSDFASGYALALDTFVRAGTLRVIYKAEYDTFTSSASTVASVGGSDTLDDLLVLGAQIRLMSSREIKRNFTESQGDTRRAEEVPAGAIANSMLQLQRMRRDRIVSEAARLNRMYPVRIRK
jgi:hypothetical protein